VGSVVSMTRHAAYDDIADWYETEFLAAQRGADPIGVSAALERLLGRHETGATAATGAIRETDDSSEHRSTSAADNTCLEIGCGTGTHAATVRSLGWTPVGLDLSAAMLAYAADRLPTARADAEHLPIRTASVGAAVAVMVHTDMPGYADVIAEATRVLRPGGVFVHVGVHPCFCGGFADRTDPDASVIRPGYLDAGHWTKDSWTSNGVRDKVGASHWPIPDLLHMAVEAGLQLERFAEGGTPTPTTFAFRARKPA
jgi:SAM-dependent methyltransferase